jgi:hypothetical protein
VGKFVDKVVGFNSIADLLSNFEDFARATSIRALFKQQLWIIYQLNPPSK